MIRLGLTLDASDATTYLERAERQVPFAAALALNRTAEEFQQAQQQGLQQRFTIRRPWVLQGIKIDNADRATKTKLEVIVKVDPSRDFLDKFEQGGVKTARSGGNLALPETKGPNAGFAPGQVIPASQRPRALLAAGGLGTYVRQGETHSRDSHSRTGVFVLTTSRGTGIFRRVGQGSGSRITRLYWLVPRASIRPRLGFMATADEVVTRRWPVNFAGFFADAMASA